MAAGTRSSMAVHDEFFYSGMSETLMQNAEVFDQASRGAVRMYPQQLRGDYGNKAFFSNFATIVSRRNISSVSVATDTALAQSEEISVRVARKIGPVGNTIDSLKQVGLSEEALMLAIGGQVGKAVTVDQVNTMAASAVGACKSNTDVITDRTTAAYKGSFTVRHSYLAAALLPFGDAAGDIVCWMMHSRIANDLLQKTIADNVTNVASMSIINGTVESLGRPTVVTDSSYLYTAGVGSSNNQYDIYHVLGLTENALSAVVQGDTKIVTELVTGLENLVIRYQGEYAYNVALRGYKYDTGGFNPTVATLGSSANWTQVATSDKSTLGVMLNVNWSGDTGLFT